MGLYDVVCYKTCSIHPPLSSEVHTAARTAACSLVEGTVVEIVIIVHAKLTPIKYLGAAKTVQTTPKSVGVCYVYFTTYICKKSARKRGVGLYYVMGIYYIFYGTKHKINPNYGVCIYVVTASPFCWTWSL